jgi:hypothetical protein
MKSEKANKFIDECMSHLTVEMTDHAKWQLRTAMTHAAELAELETEARMLEKAYKIILDMMTMTGFHGDVPRNIATEFIKRMSDDE